MEVIGFKVGVPSAKGERIYKRKGKEGNVEPRTVNVGFGEAQLWVKGVGWNRGSSVIFVGVNLR